MLPLPAESTPICALPDGEVVHQVGFHHDTAALVADVSGMPPRRKGVGDVVAPSPSGDDIGRHHLVQVE